MLFWLRDGLMPAMTTELRMLLFSIVLGIVHLLAASQATTAQRGVKWNMGNRDEKVPEVTGVAARINRASMNFRETFAFFAAAVLMVQVLNRSTGTSVLGAEIYFAARLFYFPIYAIGIPVVRSLVWIASMVGLVMVLIPLF